MRFQWMMGLVFFSACVDSGENPPTGSDAGALPDAPPECPARPIDFYGEACTEAPYPAVTVCHPDDTGWCIAGVCRPMCNNDKCRCTHGDAHVSPNGACYCSLD